MRRILVLLVMICSCFLFFISCTTQDKMSEPAQFTVALKPNPLDSVLTDVYVKNTQRDQSQLFITLPDVEINHYHPAEFCKGSVYVLRRTHPFSDFPDQWRDELWKYTSMKKGTRIVSSQGLDFRVSPTERDIAIVTDTTLFFVETSSRAKVAEFHPSELSKPSVKDTHIQPLTWTKGGTFFWGNTFQTVNILSFFRIITETWEVDSYDVDSLQINSSDYALNPANGMLVFSNFPEVFDVESYKHIKRSRTRVQLFLYDLTTGESRLLATTSSKDFKPKWLSPRAIEVNNPEGDGRIVISL